MPDNGLGERAATEDEVEDWTELVRAGRTATRGFRVRDVNENRRDSMRPPYGSGRASSEGDA